MVSKKYLLLIPPLLMSVVGLIVISIITEANVSLLLFLFVTTAALVNMVPFLILVGIHSRRIAGKSGPKNYSFYAAYLLALLAMVVASALLLKETALARPGSALGGAGFIFMPHITAPVMLVSYVIGCFFERCVRKHCQVYVEEDELRRKAFRNHFSRYMLIYIAIFVLIAGYILMITHPYFLPDTGIIPLSDIHEAAEVGSIRQTERLIEKGSDINARNQNGETSLHVAALYGHKNVVELLIAKGAQIDAKDETGSTPLHKSSWAGETTTVQVLIENGANVDAKNHQGQTPLHRAIYRGREKTSKILLKYGANVNSKDNIGQTPLWDAAYWAYEDLAKLLIEHDADVDVVDTYGRSIVWAARKHNSKSIETLLLQYGAKE
ncbi:MAG: ankyrin repeat domain-containing protein [Planctomycetota bacterium]|jgi:ankyrin repeat protein